MTTTLEVFFVNPLSRRDFDALSRLVNEIVYFNYLVDSSYTEESLQERRIFAEAQLESAYRIRKLESWLSKPVQAEFHKSTWYICQIWKPRPFVSRERPPYIKLVPAPEQRFVSTVTRPNLPRTTVPVNTPVANKIRSNPRTRTDVIDENHEVSESLAPTSTTTSATQTDVIEEQHEVTELQVQPVKPISNMQPKLQETPFVVNEELSLAKIKSIKLSHNFDNFLPIAHAFLVTSFTPCTDSFVMSGGVNNSISDACYCWKSVRKKILEDSKNQSLFLVSS